MLNNEWQTDPDEVGSNQCGTAWASSFAMDIDTAALLSVLQSKLNTAMQILQTGDAGEVDGAQSQLLHSCSTPLLPPHIRLQHVLQHKFISQYRAVTMISAGDRQTHLRRVAKIFGLIKFIHGDDTPDILCFD